MYTARYYYKLHHDNFIFLFISNSEYKSLVNIHIRKRILSYKFTKKLKVNINIIKRFKKEQTSIIFN